MMLGPVVCSVGGTGVPEKCNWRWASQHRSQWNLMPMALVRRGCMLLFKALRAVVLSSMLWNGLSDKKYSYPFHTSATSSRLKK